jgi:hypothetical protein
MVPFVNEGMGRREVLEECCVHLMMVMVRKGNPPKSTTIGQLGPMSRGLFDNEWARRQMEEGFEERRVVTRTTTYLLGRIDQLSMGRVVERFGFAVKQLKSTTSNRFVLIDPLQMAPFNPEDLRVIEV